jgi:DNA-binding NtrC family response regulator
MRGGVKRTKRPDAPFYVYMLAAERVFLAHELRARRWNRKRTAEDLGISYRSILLKIKLHKLKPARW